ncbi:MAG: class I SAM-dependent methyltransferase [Robiginitalea sp.]|nr:class I SAM-dependent methyltransferase [Robiginitalea sp.]
MRFHRNLITGVIEALDAIFNGGVYADKALETLLKKNRRWGSRDRGFVAETVYDIVRWKRLFSEIAGVAPPYEKAEGYRLFAVWALLKGYALPPWPEFKGIPAKAVQQRHASLTGIRKFRESIPDWLDLLGEKSLGADTWTRELAALNQQADVVLRANRLRTTPEALQKELAAEGIATDLIPGYPDALRLRERGNVFRSQAFRKGLFEVQDAASQLVAPFLQAEPGMRVIDACAGAGGKTLHLAALMENKGQLLALDIYDGKLKELKKRAKRAWAFNIETRLIASSKVIKRLSNTADRVLIDAPCTGLGVLRRNPDAKWKLQPEFVQEVCLTQQDLLMQYSGMLKRGGQMVYATCSILPDENEHQVATFLKSGAGKDFQLLEERHVFPSREGFDGFYMARLGRKD